MEYNAFDMKYKSGLSFHYQIGDVKTNIPWRKPNYNKLYNYFSDKDVLSVLSNFKSYLIGKCLWDFDTYDIDLYLIPIHIIEINELENFINKLNNISLNKYKIYTDITISNNEHVLPTKETIINTLKNNIDSKFDYINEVTKIGYYKKKIGDIESIIDFNIISKKRKNTIILGEKNLIRYNYTHHDEKIINRIKNSSKDILIDKLLISDFLRLNEKEFTNIQNY